jgi:hypothetical protein
MLMAAGKKSNGKKANREQKHAERRQKTATSGGRAERSEVVHETPQKRGGMRKPVQELKAERKPRISPTSPSKFTNISRAEMPRHHEQRPCQEQPKFPPILSSEEPPFSPFFSEMFYSIRRGIRIQSA